MAKPIVLIQGDFDHETIDQMRKHLTDKLNDYHVLLIESFDAEFSFEVFYEKDFKHVKYNELKNIIKEAVKAPHL